MWLVALCIAISVAGSFSEDAPCEMRTFDNEFIVNHNYDQLFVKSAEECKTACQNDATKTCKSAEYYKPSKRCFLSKKTYEAAKRGYRVRTSNKFTLFAVCKAVANFPVHGYSDTVIISNNYDEVRHISAEECKITCQTDSTKKCKSAEYLTTLRRCYFSTKTYVDAKKEHLLRTVKNYILFADPPANTCEYVVYNKTVIVSNNVTPYNPSKMTIDECRYECNAAAGCKSFEYNHKAQRCFISLMTHGEGKGKGLIRSLDDYTMYSCPDPEPPVPNFEVREYDNTVIVGNNYKEIRYISAEKCKTDCQTDATKTCKSAEYHKTLKRCFFSKKTYADAKKEHLLRTNKNSYILFAEPEAATTTTAPTTAPTSAGPTDIPIDPSPCIEWKTHPGSFIVGYDNAKHKAKTVEQCKSLCEKTTDFECASFDYYVPTSTCFLSTVWSAEMDIWWGKKRTSDKFNIHECLRKQYGKSNFLVIPRQSPMKAGGMNGFKVETIAKGSSYIQVWRKDAVKNNFALVYQRNVNFPSAGIHTISFVQVQVQDGDFLGFTTYSSSWNPIDNVIKYSNTCSNDKNTLIRDDPDYQLRVGVNMAIDDMYAVPCRDYQISPVMTDAEPTKIKEYGFEIKEQPTLGTEEDRVIGLQPSTLIRGGLLVGWKFYAKTTGPLSLLIMKLVRPSTKWSTYSILHRQKLIVTKVGVNVVYTLDNVSIPPNSIMGIAISKGEKMAIPYKEYTCSGETKLFFGYYELSRTSSYPGRTGWGFKPSESCRDYAIAALMEDGKCSINSDCDNGEVCNYKDFKCAPQNINTCAGRSQTFSEVRNICVDTCSGASNEVKSKEVRDGVSVYVCVKGCRGPHNTMWDIPMMVNGKFITCTVDWYIYDLYGNQ